MIAGILAASRNLTRYLVTVVMAATSAALCSRFGFKIHFAPAYDPVVLAVPEMLAVALAAGAIVLTRPRLWIIERFGVASRSWLSTGVAVAAVIGGPQLVLAAADIAAMPQTAWPHAATSMLFLSAVGVLGAPYFGAQRAAGLVIGAYLVLSVVAQLSPLVEAWSPLATTRWPEAGPVPTGKVAVAGMAVAVGLLIAVRTQGLSGRTWERRR